MNGNTNPSLSIGLAVYNGSEFLVETLASILAQTYTDYELIISDNASTDQTEEICCRYAANDDRIRPGLWTPRTILLAKTRSKLEPCRL